MQKNIKLNFDLASNEPLATLKSVFSEGEIVSLNINNNHEWPNITLELSNKKAFKKFASFYLNKPLSELTREMLNELKYEYAI